MPRASRHDWLASYGDAETLALALDRMAEFRLRRPNPLAGSGAELLREYAGLEADFLAFLPDAVVFAGIADQAREAGVYDVSLATYRE